MSKDEFYKYMHERILAMPPALKAAFEKFGRDMMAEENEKNGHTKPSEVEREAPR